VNGWGTVEGVHKSVGQKDRGTGVEEARGKVDIPSLDSRI
jgi:hypothetical protein